MSLLSSKVIAINIVDLSDQKLVGSHPLQVPHAFDESETRIQLLERQIEDLKQWKASFTPNIQTPKLAAITEIPRSPLSSSASSVSSAHTRDVEITESTDDRAADHSAVRSILAAPKVHATIQTSVKTPQASRGKPDLATQIVDIIQSYGHNEDNSDGNAWLGREKFEPRVRKAIENQSHIPLVLPAFPWKSVNKVDKVTGALPDLGEVLALGRLNQLCEDIEEIYPLGARVTITTDGLCYNDLLGIPDEEVYDYGSALRMIPDQKGYKNIDFLRINNLLGLTDKTFMPKEEYLRNTDMCRETLMQKYLDPTFITTEAIEKDTDINMTYCGYLRFLATDLRHSPITAGVEGKNEYRRVVKRVAQDMITRGKAFAAAIAHVLPDHVRLSIHRSTGLNKLSFPLVPQPNHFSMSPWHCSIVVTSRGEFRTAHKSGIEKTHNLMEYKGRPYCFLERSPLFDWDGAEFEFEYPRTLIIRAKPAAGQEPSSLGEKEMKKVKELAKGFSPVITSGFSV